MNAITHRIIAEHARRIRQQPDRPRAGRRETRTRVFIRRLLAKKKGANQT